ncbi:MAG: hypothetical protein KGZ60_03130 [Truepera sp.]|nr:hypothetical protein [Truepera sp.]
MALELFRHPPSSYRGTPFWAWNNNLDQAQLLRQIEVFKQMGLGGFHIHARTGLATEYLGDDFMDCVTACVAKAKEEGMLAWLYDEDRWPSGFAGGLVTRDAKYRAKRLLFTKRLCDKGELLARYQVVLEGGFMASYRRLKPDEAADDLWLAYLATAQPSPWFNHQTYVDTLSKEAIERFVAITYERYAEAVGAHFGTVIPAIFTDEPQFTHQQSFRYAGDTGDLIIPWTDDFAATYLQAYGQDLLEHLPELFWELPDGAASVVRYRYHDHLGSRFAEAFAGTLGRWCDKHGLMLTGHLMEEPTLQSQTAAVGEAMRSLAHFQLPGIDMLCDRLELTTAKQAQSVARQYGRPGVLSELYGVTNWDFPFRGHKGQGDWQAALGVTVRVPHLAWVSMAGEAKRDYPASIHYQSPWWREYPLIEDHFARVNVLITQGQPRVRVGVIHPIESYWLCFGPQAQTALERNEREANFQNLTEWLLFGLFDFDFIAESLLPELCPVATAPLPVGEMAYQVVIVPSMRTIRTTTLERLEAFRAAGGELLFVGEVPSLLDAQPSDRAARLAAQSRHLPFSRRAVLEALKPWREVSVRLADGSPATTVLHQLRSEGERRYLFLCNTAREESFGPVEVRVPGSWKVTQYDTFSGDTHPAYADYQDETVIPWELHAHSHLLVGLEPGRAEIASRSQQREWRELARLPDPLPVTLSEPNVLLLDQAAYRLDDEPWQATEEILRLDHALRRRLGWPLRLRGAQPWAELHQPAPDHTLSLKFTIHSDVSVEHPQLALEAAKQVRLFWNGRAVPTEVTGWWVDEALETVPLPPFEAGTHELVLTMPYGPRSQPEWCYLLGDFGVTVQGQARLTAPVRELAFGDWTRQGLPFYAGNVTYHGTLEAAGEPLAIGVPKFTNPLLAVNLDGNPVGRIAFAPYRLELGHVPLGSHRLEITAYGNRLNAFGPVHLADAQETWIGPNAWRSEGERWSYEYQLKPMGILSAPLLLVGSVGSMR